MYHLFCENPNCAKRGGIRRRGGGGLVAGDGYAGDGYTGDDGGHDCASANRRRFNWRLQHTSIIPRSIITEAFNSRRNDLASPRKMPLSYTPPLYPMQPTTIFVCALHQQRHTHTHAYYIPAAVGVFTTRGTRTEVLRTRTCQTGRATTASGKRARRETTASECTRGTYSNSQSCVCTGEFFVWSRLVLTSVLTTALPVR